MLKIAFHSNQLSERGTEVALYDYARYNEEVLGNVSYIVSNRNADLTTEVKFRNRFDKLYKGIDTQRVILYDNPNEISEITKSNDINILYAEKFGCPDGILSNTCKNAVHAVFDAHSYNKHGDAYASISNWLSKQHSFGSIPYVPYIVHLEKHNDNMREELGIPKNAIVLGRHGGKDQFSIQFVHKVVYEILQDRSDVYFLFMNTNKFGPDHDRIIHIGTEVNEYNKVKFINTCNAMLHARIDGETFGLAVAEFSFMNKPVLTWRHGIDNAHIDMLGDMALTYSFDADLYKMIIDIEQFLELNVNWDCYSKQFSPEKVMTGKFKNIFIDPLVK